MVTNNHVVSDATTVNVTFADGESYEAQVKSTDSDTDLAIFDDKIVCLFSSNDNGNLLIFGLIIGSTPPPGPL